MSERSRWVLQAAAGGLVALNGVRILEAARVTIRHDPPACVLAEAFPRLVAWVDPPGQAARVRVAFRPQASEVWHAVGAELTDSGFVAVLPRPRLAAQRIHYRFEATDPGAVVVTSPAYSAEVVSDAAGCGGRVAETVPSASVMVEVPPGAPLVPPVPPGFDPVGAVSSTPHKGSSRKKVGLLAGVVLGSGAVAAGVAAAGGTTSSPSTLLSATWGIRSSNPPLFGTVSIMQGSLTAEVGVVPPRSFTPGEAWVVFYNQANPVNHPCAVVAGAHPQLVPGEERRFTVNTPFVTATPCGMSVLARLVLRTTGGQQLFETGSADIPDQSFALTFVP